MTETTRTLSGLREQQMTEAANLLLDARRTGVPMADLPGDLRPVDLEEAYCVQDAIALAHGEIGGWKVGAPSLEATPLFAPMPAAWIGPSGSVLAQDAHRYRGLEAEIAFLVGEDLAPRAAPYTREEVLGAMASCHPAIEVLESGLIDPVAASRMSMISDLQMLGSFVYGPACEDWRKIDFGAERVTLAIDGTIRVDAVGSNTSGDLLRLLPWLASYGAVRTGGLRRGQWITTGSWTGNIQAMAESSVDAAFSTAGRVSLRFA